MCESVRGKWSEQWGKEFVFVGIWEWNVKNLFI